MYCPSPPCPISLNHHITRRAAVKSHVEQLAFLMDDVKTVQHLNESHRNLDSTLHYYSDPVIYNFNGMDKIKRLKAEVLIIDVSMITYNSYGGARGVIVIVVGNEHGDTSSNPGRD